MEAKKIKQDDQDKQLTVIEKDHLKGIVSNELIQLQGQNIHLFREGVEERLKDKNISEYVKWVENQIAQNIQAESD